MLDDYAGWLVELFHTLQRRVGISDVVVRKRFALNLLCGGNGRFFHIFFYIEGCLLVAVLAIAHILLLNEVQIQRTREATGGFFAFTVVGRNHAAEVVSDHAVVGGGVFEGFNREIETGVEGQRTFVSIHLFNNGVVVAALHHDGHVFMVLSSRAHHGRAADINVLYRIFQRAAFACHGLGERIQVNDNHIDRGDVVLFHNGIVLAATTEDAAVDFWMQGLYASIHHFRETGVIGNFGHRQAFFC
ncbi:hypothetical protein Senen01_04664 [Salmonella enterica subsp. enterica]